MSQPKQLFFNLRVRDPYSFDYFVVHSGVVAAVELFRRNVENLATNPNGFSMVCVYGPPSSGKSHLVHGFAGQIAQELSATRVAQFDFSNGLASGEDSKFCATYEELRAEGGLLLVEARVHPGDVTANPHVRSRLLAGEIVPVSYPTESELKPLLSSILERRNVRISEKILDYLISRLPRDLLSFDAIFDRIDELSFNESRRLGLGVVRDAVKG